MQFLGVVTASVKIGFGVDRPEWERVEMPEVVESKIWVRTPSPT